MTIVFHSVCVCVCAYISHAIPFGCVQICKNALKAMQDTVKPLQRQITQEMKQ